MGNSTNIRVVLHYLLENNCYRGVVVLELCKSRHLCASMATFWDKFLSVGLNTNLPLQNIVLLVIFLITTWKVFGLLFHQQSSAPGPKGLPIIGNMLDLKVANDAFSIDVLNKWVATYGPILQFRPAGAFGKR